MVGIAGHVKRLCSRRRYEGAAENFSGTVGCNAFLVSISRGKPRGPDHQRAPARRGTILLFGLQTCRPDNRK